MIKKVAFLTTIFPMRIEYLYDFFNSLNNQTYEYFDIIVVNDGFDEFEKLKTNYKQLNIYELKYSSTPAKNREHGINYIIDNKYDVVVFGDSDDYFQNNRVQVSIDKLINYDIVVNDLSLFNNEKSIYCTKYISNRIKNNTEINYSFINDKNIFGMTNTSLNVSILDKVVFENNLVAVDWFLYKDLLKKGYKAVFTNETVSYYRQYSDNIVGLNSENGEYLLWWEKNKVNN